MTPDDVYVSAELARLRSALTERYAIGDMVGEGGMATVYRATDLKHAREVAIKVLRPDVSHGLGAERFLREIEIAASLQHPRILPLYDSGASDGQLYYVMPLVEGETLRDRIAREKQLPVDEAIRIAREVASALAYAHAKGVVHRDIKPANIYLSGGEAIVADFGIARALKAAGSERLTMTGMGIGTPAYMSPEQVGGEFSLDHRSDIYSMGCLLYEMIAGQPPFTGATAESVVMQHMAAQVPRVGIIRPAVPPAVEQVIQRALAKVPADRFSSAAEFAEALTTPVVQPLRPRALSSGTRRLSWRMVVAAILLVAATVAITLVLWERGRPPTDPAAVAVLPFRVSGDSSFAFLREGMVDLMTTQIASTSGLRPLDSRAVLSAWRRAVREGEEPSTSEARTLAANLGGGRLVLGSIVGTGNTISIGASMIDVDGGTQADASVQGPRDSLFALVDRLMFQLAAGLVREPARRLEDLTSASLPAVRAYLEGRAAYRRGENARAVARFTEALELDSTFALAALGMAASGVWSQQAGQSVALRRGLRTGYALRSRLSLRDRLLFEAYVPPSTSGPVSAANQLRGWQRAAEAALESPEAQYEYGDRLYHSGEQLGIANAQEYAKARFDQTVALDSSFAPALAHLVEIAARSGDRAETRRLVALYRANTGSADAGDYVRWRVALATGDRSTLEDLRGRIRELSRPSINRIIGFGLTDGAEMRDIDAAAAELRRRYEAGTTAGENVHPSQSLHSWALNRGRRAEAAQAIASMHVGDTLYPGSSLVFSQADQLPVLDALFWTGDTVPALQVVGRIEERVRRVRPRGSADRARYYTDVCVAALWHQRRGAADALGDDVTRLRVALAARDSSIIYGVDPGLCLTAVEALMATASKAPNAGALTARMDSIMVSGPYLFGSDWGNLVVAQLHEARGDHAAALRALRRRPYDWDTGPLYLTRYLREEGRLAAMTGDRAGARRAYERFLVLRAGADASYQAQTDSVKRELAALR